MASEVKIERLQPFVMVGKERKQMVLVLNRVAMLTLGR